MKTNRILVLVGVALATALSCANLSMAAVITLTGGDSTDGWVAPITGSFVAAYDVGGNGETIQTIAFQNWADPSTTTSVPHITASGITGPFNYGSPSLGVSPDDTAMATMQSRAGYSFDNNKVGPITLTMTGLTALTRFRIDVFQHAADPRREIFMFTDNGGTNVLTDDYAGSASFDYLVQNVRTADSSGQIVLNITTDAGRAAVVTGIAISFAPEPASLGLLACGGVMSVRRRK